MMVKNLGISYKGSKRKLAPALVNFMLKENPKAKYFYDLFGGGGAISFYAIQKSQIKKVFYNELNTGVVELLKDIITNGVTEKYYKWIDKETFNRCKNDNTWFGGLCKCIWSFSNNQTDYLYGKDIAEYKRLLHEIIVNKCRISLTIFNKRFNNNIKLEQRGLFEAPETIQQRRLRILRDIKEVSLKRLQNLESLINLESLRSLRSLEVISKLEDLEKFEILNLSFEEVKIDTPVDETIIYLDPPYENTRGYQELVNYKELYTYIEKSPYKIYLSSYESHLPCILELKRRVLSSQKKDIFVVEKLFTNKL